MKIKIIFCVILLILFVGAVCYDMVKQPKLVKSTSNSLKQNLDASQWKELPELTFTDLSGKKFSSKDFKGKVLLLNFWATWCPTCIKDFPGMIKLVEKFNGDVQIVALSNDEQMEDISTFLEEYKVKYNEELKAPNLFISWDQNKVITNDVFNTVRFPETIIISKDSRMVKKLIGEVKWDSAEISILLRELVNQNNGI